MRGIQKQFQPEFLFLDPADKPRDGVLFADKPRDGVLFTDRTRDGVLFTDKPQDDGFLRSRRGLDVGE